MSKKYKAKESTGREFVDSTCELCGYTIHRCMKLPAEWGTYLLDPLVADVSEMERLVLLGNRVYINEEKLPADKCIEAYETRDEYLVQALRYLDDFDAKFERLMSCVNVAGSEMRRLKSAMYRILDDIRQEHPDLEKVKIQMVAHRDSMEYVAENGSVHEKLSLNAKNRDHWLFLRQESEEWIRKRLSWDKNAIKKLSG